MILTCPECATSYFVDELRIPPAGRMVKCTSCGSRWRAFQDGADAPPPPPVEERVAEPPPAPPPADDLAIVAAPIAKAKKPKKVAEPKEKKPAPVLAIGVGVAAVLAVAIGATLVLRQQVAEIAPATAPVFAALGLPVNTLGLVIEGVKSQATFQAGRPVLSVTGAIRNVRKEAADAPPIRINLLDKDGKAVRGVLAQPMNAKLPPGAVRYFAVSLPDPPAGASELEVAFEVGEGGHAPKAAHATPAAHAPAAHAPVAAAPAGPAPIEAQPLPADSPDALTKHE